MQADSFKVNYRAGKREEAIQKENLTSSLKSHVTVPIEEERGEIAHE